MKCLFNDGWSFLLTAVGTTREQAEARKAEFTAVDIPHDWLIYDSQHLYDDGTGWYRKCFSWEEDTDKKVSLSKLFLSFEGIYMDSTVYVNGSKAGEWKYGYSGFTLDVTDYIKKGNNEIMVSACFQGPNSRWYSGAGIYRNVWLKATGQTYIAENGIYISTRRQQEDFVLRAVVDVKGKNGTLKHKLFENQADGALQEVPIKQLSNAGEIGEYLVAAPKLWDIESPQLYTLQTELWQDGSLIQQEENIFGFRETAFDSNKGFFLNGRRVKLNGVCEHHDLGALGAAFYPEAMRRKFRILKEMGVNAVRGTHNMMAPGFMELADEMGILLISEAFDMWERSKTTYDYARFFKEWSAKDVESWVRSDRNHPSVIMWSIGNEIYDTHAGAHGQEITQELMKLVRKFDPEGNAAITIGSNYMPWENAQKCADLVKLAGYNYSEKYYRQHHKEHPDWVIYGSETSSIVQSRGVYHFPLKAGILAEDDEQCSALGNSPTSWGAKSLEACITIDRDTEFSMGQFLWTGFDYIGEPTPYHTKNSYFGQVDTAGFPKDIYYVWQSVWTDYRKNPMIHIFPYWDFNEGQLIDVRVCSNAPEVELFLNGISLGRQGLTHEPGTGKHILADYQIPYKKGVLKAVAYNENGQEISVCEKHSFGDSKKISLQADKTTLKADGRDLLFVEIGTADGEGNPVENACDRVCVEVSGAGSLIGLDNGDSTDCDSYKGKSRRLFNGKLLAIVRAGLEPGEIHITVAGKGLKQAELACQSIALQTETSNNCLWGNWAADGRYGLSALEANKDMPIVLGREDEIPVRKVTLTAKEGQNFTPEKKIITVEACVEPANAQDQALIFRAVNDKGVSSNLVILEQDGHKAVMTALGDGEFRLRCMSKSGTDSIRLISQLEFTIQGLGQAFLDPYDFISGSSFSSVIGEAGNGNERGVATARDGETTVSYSNIDFGSLGSDTITVPVFALSSEEYAIQIWEGIPREPGSELLADVIYQKPTQWNVYQEDTWQLKRFVKGITTISFRVHQKIHIKGFSFRKYEKARFQLPAASADAIYGDSFKIAGTAVKEIGNNVSLVFSDMDFGKEGAERLRIKGRAPEGNNTIHVRFFDGTIESKQIVEFEKCKEWEEQEFLLEPLAGKWEVTFVFLPGSCFDFGWLQFKK